MKREPAALATVLSLEALAQLAARDDAPEEVHARFRTEFNPEAMLRVFAAFREVAIDRGLRWERGAPWPAPAKRGPGRPPGPARRAARKGNDACAACGGDRGEPWHSQIHRDDYHAFVRRPR